MDIYREQLLDHYRHPRGWGLQVAFDRQHTSSNPSCGDTVTIQVRLDQECIAAIYFEGHGCVISRAAASLLTEYLRGQSVSQVNQVQLPDIEQLLQVPLPPSRVSCALLPLKTIQVALQ